MLEDLHTPFYDVRLTVTSYAPKRNVLYCNCYSDVCVCLTVDEEQAVCLAIALSIQDTSSPSAGCITPAAASSTVESYACQHSSEHGGFAQPTETLSSVCGSSSNSSHKLLSHGAAHCTGSTYEFEFRPSLVAGDTNMESVFEPRPPHPLSSPQPGRAGQRCALAHDETVTVLDPWRRRPSSLDHGRPHKSSHCTRPAETCGAGSGKKSKSSSRRRRSCGNHLPHRTPPDIGYLSDRTISPVPSSVDHVAGSAGSRAAVNRDRQPPADSLDLVISSDILESMLQGAEGYCIAAETMAPVEAPAVSSDNCMTQQVASKDDCDSVFL